MFDPLPTGIILPDWSRAAVLRPHCNDCIAGSYTAAGCEAGSNIEEGYAGMLLPFGLTWWLVSYCMMNTNMEAGTLLLSYRSVLLLPCN